MMIPILMTVLTCAAILWIVWYYGQFPGVKGTGALSRRQVGRISCQPIHGEQHPRPARSDEAFPWPDRPPWADLRFRWTDFHDDIGRLLQQLPAQDAQVIRRYFGIGRRQAVALEEIGATLNLSPDQVRRIRDKALSRLRQMSAGSGSNALHDNLLNGLSGSSMDPAQFRKSFDVTFFFSCLSSQERAVVARYLGLNGESVCGLEEIAMVLGLTQEQVRNIRRRAMVTLRSLFDPWSGPFLQRGGRLPRFADR